MSASNTAYFARYKAGQDKVNKAKRIERHAKRMAKKAAKLKRRAVKP